MTFYKWSDGRMIGREEVSLQIVQPQGDYIRPTREVLRLQTQPAREVLRLQLRPTREVVSLRIVQPQGQRDSRPCPDFLFSGHFFSATIGK